MEIGVRAGQLFMPSLKRKYSDINDTMAHYGYKRIAASVARGKGRVAYKNGYKSKYISRYPKMVKNRKFFKKGAWRDEIKYYDLGITGGGGYIQATLSGKAYLLSGVPQGSTANQRVGRKITAVSLLLRMHVRKQSSAKPDSVMRMIVFLWKTGVTTPAVGDILLNVGNGVDIITSPLKLANMSQFEVLKDVTFELDGGHGNEQFYQLYKKMSIDMEFLPTSTGGAFGDASKNAMVILFVGNQAGAGDEPDFGFQARLRYSDV